MVPVLSRASTSCWVLPTHVEGPESYLLDVEPWPLATLFLYPGVVDIDVDIAG